MLRSTTFRFAALVFLLQVAAAAVLILTIGIVVRGQVKGEAARVVGVLRDDLRATYDAGGVAGLTREVALRTARVVTPGTVLMLVDRGGRRLAGNLDAWPPSIAADAGGAELRLYRSGAAVAEDTHVEAVRLAGGERLLVGTTVAGEARVLRRLERASGAALPLALVFAALAAWIAARMIVGRLHEPSAALAAVARGNLAARVPADRSRDAFATLGAAINGALEQVEWLMTELRVATDGLAHDLKSPLTRLRVALERAAALADGPAAQEAVDRALAEADRLFRIVDTALRITRAEAGMGRESFVPVDLSAELAGIADMYAPVAEDAGRPLVVEIAGGIRASVHRELLAQAVGNLLDNALKYGAGAIGLSLSREAGALCLVVRDRGRGIAAAQRGAALRRFGRLDDARGGNGAGLGLSLAAAVAHLHGGRIELDDGAPGLVVRLHMPA